VIVTGCITAIVLLLFSTYSYAPDKVRYALWVPSMFLHSRLVHCPEDPGLRPHDCPSEMEPDLALLFGSFFVFYFIVGAGIGAAVIAVRRGFRKDNTE
jgi:hypothetical protein